MFLAENETARTYLSGKFKPQAKKNPDVQCFVHRDFLSAVYISSVLITISFRFLVHRYLLQSPSRRTYICPFLE